MDKDICFSLSSLTSLKLGSPGSTIENLKKYVEIKKWEKIIKSKKLCVHSMQLQKQLTMIMTIKSCGIFTTIVSNDKYQILSTEDIILVGVRGNYFGKDHSFITDRNRIQTEINQICILANLETSMKAYLI